MKQWYIKSGWVGLALLSAARYAFARPLVETFRNETEANTATDNGFYIRVIVCAVLVLAGGLLAGLTLGLMSLDETNLHILATSGSEKQRQYAKRIQPIRKNGHWLLVTLLLGNTVINETLPIVMDSILGGGVMAVLVSTASIVLFGEIIPQSLCARYGLAIGAFFAYPVRVLQYLLAPLGYPIAMLLDYVLGPDHGVIYKKAQLKELVLLSDTAHGGNLSADEVTIIRGALELGEKRVVEVMTQLRNVYMVDINAKLDRKLLTEMLRQGHSRVPVYEGERVNVVGVLLVKSLILLDPDDAVPVREAKITGIPLVTPDVSLHDILNAFQEGGSHMAVVVGPTHNSGPKRNAEGETMPLLNNSTTDDGEQRAKSDTPPPMIRKLSSYIRSSSISQNLAFGEISHETVQNFVPLGIITLEDVIEELIQEEIIDETDVFVDMRRNIKVMRAVKLAQSMGSPTLGALPVATPVATPSAVEIRDAPSPKATKRRGVAFSSRRRNED
ncbi:DUF21-domain-containing protein [Coemansia reversa NRRL 1564]|uniref:DUF21-domain-containing protein n=1 Tax=Coemansia reversa (strain ATCC 12441 / NRRL 1564) TaxID=763665 RepID=A0A2G5B681_COERN|nr:DUF21-domain-containing protein [Coemansia reversa NRRL 1564]|eukprot:PIA14553.1 DUF21-domain-containing protein [Coemansia reversa NRRL 1564]